MFHTRNSHYVCAALSLPSFYYNTANSHCITFLVCVKIFRHIASSACVFSRLSLHVFLSTPSSFGCRYGWCVCVCLVYVFRCPGFELWNLFKSHEQRLDTRAYLGSFNNLHVFAIQSYRLRWHQVKLFPLVDFQLVLNLSKCGGAFPLQILFK